MNKYKFPQWLKSTIDFVRREIVELTILYFLSGFGIIKLRNILNMQTPLWLVILLLLTITFCFLIAIIIHSSKSSNIQNYEFINPPGFLKHKKSGKYYCQTCFIKDNIISELSLMSLDKYQCRLCKEPYKEISASKITQNLCNTQKRKF